MVSQGKVIGCSGGKTGDLFENVTGDLGKQMLKSRLVTAGFSDTPALPKSCFVSGDSQ